jgi:hypothetical protein
MLQMVDDVVVFDTNLDARELRWHRAENALRRCGIQPLPDVSDFGDRMECLEFLHEQVTGKDRRVLLLCDMVADGLEASVGNVGARLLRTVATDRQLRAGVWRVLWTQHDHPYVIRGIAPYAHAFVWFDHHDRDGGLLANGIAHALAAPPVTEDGEPGVVFQSFAPRGLTDETHTRRVRESLTSLLAPGALVKINDELAIASILRGDPDNETNRMLAAAREPLSPHEKAKYCESVNELLERVRGSAKSAREAIHTEMDRFAQTSVATALKPGMVELTSELLRRNVSAMATRQLRYQTGLTEGEDELARSFDDLYRQHFERLSAEHLALTRRLPQRGSTAVPNAALKAAVDDPALNAPFAHPDIRHCAEEPRRREALSYVIWTMVDTARSLDRAASQPTGAGTAR